MAKRTHLSAPHGGLHGPQAPLLCGIPTAVISAWLGHSDSAFTLRVYVHSQPEVLNDVARHFERSL